MTKLYKYDVHFDSYRPRVLIYTKDDGDPGGGWFEDEQEAKEEASDELYRYSRLCEREAYEVANVRDPMASRFD